MVKLSSEMFSFKIESINFITFYLFFGKGLWGRF